METARTEHGTIPVSRKHQRVGNVAMK
jgi:hypothetical protein